MTHRQRKHAEQVVQRFAEMLSPSGRQHVGQAHLDELTLLVEAAISGAVLEAMESVADQLESMAHQMRTAAEHFDNPPAAEDQH